MQRIIRTVGHNGDTRCLDSGQDPRSEGTRHDDEKNSNLKIKITDEC